MSGTRPTLPLYAFKACTGTASLFFLPVAFTQENNRISVTNEKSISDGLLRVSRVAVLSCEPAGTRICDAELGRIEADFCAIKK
jgi:hypothetical protein